ncbi:UDP-glycosyltransferase 74F2-like [Impatiens glandulifera]|uniref:UDP-glycosyltransferase 74F2-like n=1 Tax=Impatiens glandulifera TaxID=253017 RepID=UPI001FB15649|nr:UDP-glycosyltransferase 74F2-like [Impatiens glandulifera]
MENRKQHHHVLAIPYPTQGHINPMLQFFKRLVSKNLKTTLAITKFHFNSTHPPPSINSISIDTISDGFDDAGYSQASDSQSYLETFQIAGSKTLLDLISRHQTAGNPIDCVVYDSFIPWVFDVVKPLGIKTASFFTQPCAVNFLYYNVSIGKIPVGSSVDAPVTSIPGLPLLTVDDLPPFVSEPEVYVPYRDMVFGQFRNVVEADFVFVNTFYELEEEVVNEMSKYSPLITIGPTIPSFYLDKRVENDNDYGLNLFESDPSTTIQWLSSKPKGSVVYVSFGSLSDLGGGQMEEILWGLKGSEFNFLWVIRATEMPKFPDSFVNSEKGLVVGWCPQLEVLANDAVGCFFSHAGWNSTIEAMSLGVPMVVMPQWTDQPMNAKLAEDVWKVAIRVRLNEKGIVGRDEVERCVREVMDGESGKEMKMMALKWRDLAKEAIDEGGSSDINIDNFIKKLSDLKN